MSLSCCSWDDPEYFVTLADPMIISVGTEFCHECRKLIPVGTEHYRVDESTYDDNGDEVYTVQHKCCETCGDLALSWLAMGYCWDYGTLRSSISEYQEYL